MAALQAAIAAKHPAEQIKEKVAAVRAARQSARAGLQAVENDLLQLLTADQEAVLVGLGFIN